MAISLFFNFHIAYGWQLRIFFVLSLAAGILSACSGSNAEQAEIEPGLSKEEVTRILGDPTEVNEFSH